MVNGLQGKCEGLITRERHTVNGVEKSIIDFVIVSQDLVEYVGKMIIDDKRKYVLTRLTKTKHGIIKKKSDHNTMITELRVKWKSDRKSSKNEVYNLKSKECQKSFKQDTEDTSELSNIIDKDEDIDKITKKFVHRLDGFIKKHFKKVRVTEKVDKDLENLYKQKAELKNKDDRESKKRLEEVEAKMANN